MPLAAAIAPALIGAATAIGGAAISAHASSKATAAQNAAAAQQLAAQQANLDRITGLNQPFITGGQGAYAKLLQQFGIAPAGTAGTSPPSAPAGGGMGGVPAGYNPNAAAPAGYGPGPGRADDTFIDPRTGAAPGGAGAPAGPGAASGPGGTGAGAGGAPSGPEYPGAPYTSPGTPAGGGGFDADTYLQQNPDVAADFEQHQAEYAARGITTPQQAAAAHYEQYGKTEGRAEPMNPVTPGTPGTVVNPDLMNSPRPVAPAGPEFGPRTDVAMGDFGSAPDLASYFSHFEADPGAAYRRDQALDSVNAKSAARGMLRSGGAVKALATLGSDLASQEYNNWFTRQNTLYNNARNAFTTDRSFQGNLWDTKQQRSDNNYTDDRGYKTGRWQYDVDRGDTNFNIDRGYQTDRGDTNTRNLFDLTRVGLDAAGNVSGAGTHFADSASSIYGNKADAASANYFNRAQANSYALNGVANAGANLFANWGGGARTPAYGGTAQNPYSVSTKNVRF